MAAAMDYIVILVLVAALGAFLFLVSTIIFLLEEAAMFLLKSIRSIFVPAQVWVAAHVRHSVLCRSLHHNQKP